MDLRSGHPFWLVKNGLIDTYPPLETDLTCEVVVIGGGITGALVTYQLAQEGVDVVVLDKRDIAWGSTSASTAMLQYEIDKELHELSTIVGKAQAVRSYRLGVEALDRLEEITAEIGAEENFCRVESIYATRYKRHLRRLQTEYAARKESGLQVRYIERAELAERYGIDAQAAIVSAEGATTDAYVLTYALFARSRALGARIFDRSEVTKLVQHSDGVEVQTDRNCILRAAKVVFATGYETQQYLQQKITDLHATFALVSEPTALAQQINQRYLLWETARPYFYLRATTDNRLILGGGDEPFHNPEKRDRLIAKKSQQLLKLFHQFYPTFPPPEIAYAWAGTFGETADGLAYIGESPEVPNAYFALGYGGNGITYSVIAARIITDLYLGRPNGDVQLFRFCR
ncbi:MAG: FAD-binding oxidoreductase [Caldilineaceae bacterium]